MMKWIAAVSVLLFTGAPGDPQVAAQAPTEQNQVQEFDADYVATNSQGRYYRAADGSSRQETVISDVTRRFIFIVNMAQRLARPQSHRCAVPWPEKNKGAKGSVVTGSTMRCEEIVALSAPTAIDASPRDALQRHL